MFKALKLADRRSRVRLVVSRPTYCNPRLPRAMATVRAPTYDDLRLRFEAALSQLSPAGAGRVQASAWSAVACHYSESHRAYHNLQHLHAMLRKLEHARNWHASVHGGRADLSPCVWLAVFFHDVIYDPTRQDNEHASAQLASSILTEAGAAPKDIGRVEQMIMATEQHQLPPQYRLAVRGGAATQECASSTGSTGDTAADDASGSASLQQEGFSEQEEVELFLDADLSILASPQEEYTTYAAAIRAEYAHVPDDKFRAGRSRVLQSLLDRPCLFYSKWAHEVGMEACARANIQAELQRLMT